MSEKNVASDYLKKIAGVTAIAFLLFSCSLKYTETVNVEESVPEFVFEGTEISRYEKNKLSYKISAEKMEQYKDSSDTYAKGVSFKAYDGDEISTEGSLGILHADTKNEIYELFENISLTSHSDNIKFTAEMLKWNAKTEQFVSAQNSFVQVQTEDSVIRGSGFSSSGISKNFSFDGNVVGSIETSEKTENEDIE